MNIPVSFTPVSKSFQLCDFSKKVSFGSYCFIHSFLACKAAIFAFSMPYRKWSVYYFYLTCVYAYIRVIHNIIMYVAMYVHIALYIYSYSAWATCMRLLVQTEWQSQKDSEDTKSHSLY